MTVQTMAELPNPELRPEKQLAVHARRERSTQVRALAAEVAIKHAELLDRLAR